VRFGPRQGKHWEDRRTPLAKRLVVEVAAVLSFCADLAFLGYHG